LQGKTPEIAAEDLSRILRAYLTTWKKDKVVLIGYSLAADVLPFMANRLELDLLNRVVLIALLGPGNDANFEFHLTDWLGGGLEIVSRYCRRWQSWKANAFSAFMAKRREKAFASSCQVVRYGWSLSRERTISVVTTRLLPI